MINKIYLKIFEILINIIDYQNKKKIINFLKKNLENTFLKVLDVGAHKGETVNFFLKNFKIDKIYAFEPNRDLYLDLKKNINLKIKK